MLNPLEMAITWQVIRLCYKDASVRYKLEVYTTTCNDSQANDSCRFPRTPIFESYIIFQLPLRCYLRCIRRLKNLEVWKETGILNLPQFTRMHPSLTDTSAKQNQWVQHIMQCSRVAQNDSQANEHWQESTCLHLLRTQTSNRNFMEINMIKWY